MKSNSATNYSGKAPDQNKDLNCSMQAKALITCYPWAEIISIMAFSKTTVNSHEFAQFVIDHKCTGALYLDGAISEAYTAMGNHPEVLE